MCGEGLFYSKGHNAIARKAKRSSRNKRKDRNSNVYGRNKKHYTRKQEVIFCFLRE